MVTAQLSSERTHRAAERFFMQHLLHSALLIGSPCGWMSANRVDKIETAKNLEPGVISKFIYGTSNLTDSLALALSVYRPVRRRTYQKTSTRNRLTEYDRYLRKIDS